MTAHAWRRFQAISTASPKAVPADQLRAWMSASSGGGGKSNHASPTCSVPTRLHAQRGISGCRSGDWVEPYDGGQSSRTILPEAVLAPPAHGWPCTRLTTSRYGLAGWGSPGRGQARPLNVTRVNPSRDAASPALGPEQQADA